MPANALPTFGFWLLLAATCLASDAAARSDYRPIANFDAQTGLLVGCGVEVSEQAISVSFRQVRAGGGRGDAVTQRLEVSGAGTVEGAILATASASTAAFPTAAADGDDFASVGAMADNSSGRLFRELLIAGGELRLRRPDGSQETVRLRGPAPIGVNHAYLNCAGDLFRQEP